ncbi:MAG: tail fiber domain-containing protein, partial [Clostridium sp.]
ELTDLKFEKGNKATDWTPAPEDIDSSINVVDGKVTTTSNKVSQIEQSVNSITQRVSSTETTVTNHTTQLNSVDGKIDNAKSQAITEAIGIKDTRSNNENPQWYISNYPQKTVTEFKMANVLGLPSSLGSMYGTVETKVPWANTSGGYPTQTWRANGSATYERKGVSTTDWGPWVQIEDVNGSQGKVNSAKTELNAEITKVSDKTAELKTSIDGITQRVSSTESITTKLTTDLNLTTSLAQAMSSGKPIKTDPTFKNGTNGCGIYNNSGGSTVTFNRISKPSDCPTTSTHCLEIKTIGSPTSPGWGGFHCAVSSRANAKFIVKIMAKIPSDRTLHLASNSMGTGYSDRLITSNSGTGNYTEYIREIKCGSAGTFSSGGHFYLSGGSAPTASSPIIWYVASCEVIDVTDSDYTLQETVAEVNSVKSKTATLETNLNSITGRVSSVETTTSTINGNVSNLQTRMNTAEQKITATAITNSVSEAINNGSSSINTVTTVLDRNGFTVKNGKIIVKNSSNKDVMWVDTTGKLTTDNLEVYGSGGSTIRMSGTGSKSLVLESSDNWDVFLNFKSNANGGRIGTYKGRDHQLFVEAGAIGSSVRPLVIYRGINSTTSTNQVCDVEIHGRLKVTDNVTSKFGYMVASDTINQLIIQTKSNGSKYIHINSDIGVYGVDIWNSDAYIKENFNYAKAKALDKIMKIEHAEYNYIEGTHREVGVVAQQLQLIDENWVNEVVEFDENKKPTGHTLLQPVAHEILPYITKSIQEQQNEIEYLKEKIKILENKLISLQI